MDTQTLVLIPSRSRETLDTEKFVKELGWCYWSRQWGLQKEIADNRSNGAITRRNALVQTVLFWNYCLLCGGKPVS